MPSRLTCPPALLVEIIRERALYNQRCPSNDELRAILYSRGYNGLPSNYLAELARAGHFKLEVYGKNWRVVQIGRLRTKDAPPGWRPYKVIAREAGAPS